MLSFMRRNLTGCGSLDGAAVGIPRGIQALEDGLVDESPDPATVSSGPPRPSSVAATGVTALLIESPR